MAVYIIGSPLGLDVQGTELNIASQAQGDILFYNGSAWVVLAAGTAGKFLKTQGAAANPAWDTVTAGLKSVASGTSDGSSGTITVTGLDLDTDKLYIVKFALKNAASGGTIHLECNADTTDTNYVTQNQYDVSTTIGSQTQNSGLIGEFNAAGNYNSGYIIIHNDAESKPVAQVFMLSSVSGIGAVRSWRTSWRHNDTTNLTSLQIVCSQNLTSGDIVEVFK